mmetsp:Transcript_5730/g.11258  ORF Transcript_5730/g.11258 Transcript_5730/m.11258 type:complete len:604 (+) Transcript_5730:71-1882(+)
MLGRASISKRSFLYTRRLSTSSKPTFFDMVHSNNAARVRLWMQLKKPGGMEEVIESRIVRYPDLKTAEFAAINPLKKVPALVRADGTTVFESNVILSYLEDKYKEEGPSFEPPTAEGRQAMQLLCRVHDLYIASPNCTAPGFSHSQGAMYLSDGWHGPARGMDLPTRSAKLGELWRQLSWLEAEAQKMQGPHLLGEQLTLADLTWFPTCVFMEFMLPRVFGWPRLFDPAATEPAPTPFPALAAWYTALQETPAFRSVRSDIWEYWEQMEDSGQFQPIIDEIAACTDPTLKFRFGVPHTVMLNYQEPPPPGKFTGRYIEQPDQGDAVDVHVEAPVTMRDGRELVPPASLESIGFALKPWPTKVTNFADRDEVVATYYEEMRSLVKEASGAERVYTFDHTIRESGSTNLNATAGGSAAPVPRVHCDYTATGAPRRLSQLGKEGIYSKLRNRMLTEEDVAELAAGRFAFINVWRSIDDDFPCVMQKPLAVCDESSVPDDDRFLYQLRFPDRTGENYSLRHSSQHKWYYYTRQKKDECLVFKVYDKKQDGPRFVFHTAFEDPMTPADAPPRRSIEVRAIAFFDPPPLGVEDVAHAMMTPGDSAFAGQ